MVEGLISMEGVSQQVVRGSKQPNNSPTLQGNSGRLVTKGKGGQLKGQKFNKTCPPGNGQRNAHSGKNKPGRNYQNAQRRDYMTNKTPRSRGYKQTERFEQLSIEDKEGDLDYDFPVVSRKDQNSLNHLLNFTFAPRTQTHHAVTRKKGAVRRSYYNKEQFLQANCQFVVQDGKDYSINNIDPDVIVDWELIEQVRVRCTDVPSCPICLYHPIAAQITRCGHVYCWSCILHYLSLSDTKWRKCPICYEAVHKHDLKSVVAVSKHKNVVNQEITMSLMKRSKSSVLALPVAKWVEREYLPELTTNEEEMHFSKFLRATPQEILAKVMVKIRSQLESQLIEVENDKSDEKPFVELAIEEFQKREQRLLEMCQKDEKSIVETEVEAVPANGASSNMIGEATVEDVQEGTTKENLKDVTASNDVLPKADEGHSRGARSRSSISSDDSHSSHRSSGSSQFYYFYQADDGQQIFLHPVNVRCLIKEYGSLEYCPELITGRIVEMECLIQTEEIRRRFGYLRHLPLTCDFAMCELDLKPPILSRETLNFFKDDFRKRRARRQKKAKEEAKHEDKCRSKFSAYDGVKQPQANVEETPDLSSEHDFPQQVSSGCDVVWVASSPPGPWSTSPPFTETEVSQSGQSFAEALSTGKCSNQVRAKPKTQVAEPGRDTVEKRSENSDDDDEGDTIPTFQSAFTDALMLADWNLNVEAVQKDIPDESGRKRNKKNKKKNKRLLFSTGSAMKL